MDGNIYKGSKIVIPKSLRKEMLQKIHKGHLGIEKYKKRAREVMYWPQINKDVAIEVYSCAVCLKYRASNPPEPLKPHPEPDRPYQKVDTDLFVLNGKDYFVVTDYYSLYPEVFKLSTIMTEAVITSMKAAFSRHGVANEVFTDNGPQFSCESFRLFTVEWNFVHSTSSPHYPQPNGLVEKSVQTVKRLIQKAKDSGADFLQCVDISYHTTRMRYIASTTPDGPQTEIKHRYL